AKEKNRPRERSVRDEKYERHKSGAEAERDFSSAIERITARKNAGKTATAKASGTSRGVRNPAECADGFDIEPAGIVKVFRQPEEIRIPGCIAEELRHDNAPRLPKTKKFQPARMLGWWNV